VKFPNRRYSPDEKRNDSPALAADFLPPAGDILFLTICSMNHKMYDKMKYGRNIMRSKSKIFNLCLAGIFAALAYISTYVVYITVAGFLTYDVKDALITVCAMIIGPVYGIVVSLIVSFVELITVSGTGFWGFLMNFISSAVFAATATLIYKKSSKLSGAFIGLGCAAIATTAIMVLMNMVITPIYVHQPREAVISLIPTLLLPFNFTKSVLNAGLVLALYKPIITALRRAKLFPSSEDRAVDNKNGSLWNIRTLIVIIVAAALIAASLAYMILGLHGEIG
jgi:riboflavin transporter FmnP